MNLLTNLESLSLYLPEFMTVILILAVFLSESFPGYRHLTFKISVIGLIIIIFTMFIISPSNKLLFQGMIINDSFSYYFKYLIILSTLSVIIVSKNESLFIKLS